MAKRYTPDQKFIFLQICYLKYSVVFKIWLPSAVPSNCVVRSAREYCDTKKKYAENHWDGISRRIRFHRLEVPILLEKHEILESFAQLLNIVWYIFFVY